MKIQTKIVALILVVAFVFMSGLLFLKYFEVYRNRALFEDKIEDRINLFEKTLAIERSALEIFTHDYSLLEELNGLLNKGEKEQLDYIFDIALSSFNVNCIWVLRTDFKQVYVKNDFNNLILDESSLTKKNLEQLFLRGSYFRHFFVWTRQGPLEIYTAPIQSKNARALNEQPSGYLFAGRLWSRDYINTLSFITESSIKIVPMSKGADLQPRYDSVLGVISFSKVLESWDRTPLRLLKIRYESSVVSGFKRSSNWQVNMLIIFAFATIALVSYFLFRWVATPLNLLTKTLTTEDSIYIEKIKNQKSEFGNIAQLVLKFFNQKAELLYEISERNKVETALRESERKFRAIFDQAFQLTGLLSPEGLLLEVNQAALDFINASETDVLGRLYWKTPWWSDSVQKQAELKKAISLAASGNFVRYETQLVSSAGSSMVIDFSLKPIMDDNGDVILLLPEGRDITERIMAEEDRIRMSSAIEQAAETVIITDAEGFVQYINPAMEKITGYSLNESIGRNSFFTNTGGFKDDLCEEIWSKVVSGDVWKGHVVRQSKYGDTLESEATISPIKNKEGKIINYVSIARDVTREIRLERELKQSQKMEAIGTLAGGIAHDFNNILSTIIGNSELSIKDITPNSEVYRRTSQVLKAANRAKDLVQQILSFSHVTKQELRPIRLGPIVSEALRFLRASLPATIELRQNISTENDTVLSDPTQIYQVVMNLCTNAADAMGGSQGVVDVFLSNVTIANNDVQINPDLNPGNYVKLTVKDSGHGIDPKVIERIFDPYFTTKPQEKGTGLGLSVVHGILKKLGGSVSVNSKPDKGTSFLLFFPLVDEDLAKISHDIKDVPTGNEKIMFVDDEEDLVEVVAEMLGSLGYEVTGFNNVLEALDAFRAEPNKFDLIITDKTMPKMAGFEFASQLITIRSDISVILCTGFRETVDSEKIKQAGIKSVIMKPMLIRDLAVKIRNVFDG